MIPSTELFELIQSMSQTEKTYFKKYSRMHTVGEQNSYLLLFDAISRQKEYDEKEIIIQLAKYDFVRHFAVVKNYLYTRILDALESYHRDINISTQVRRAITRAEILHRKGLYEQSIKLTEKTRRIAKEFELNHSLLEIYSTLDLVLYTEKHDPENLQDLYHRAVESMSAIKENMLAHNLSSRMVDCYYNYSETRNEKYLKEADELMQSPLFKEASQAQSFMGKLRFNEVNYSYAYMKSDLDSAYLYVDKIASLLNSNPLHLKNNVKKYISALNNLFVMSMERENIPSARVHLLQLEKALPVVKTLSQKAMYYCFYSINLSHFFCRTGNISELQKNLPRLISQYNIYKNELSDLEKIDILIHIAISYYYTGDLKKCISFLTRLRNQFNLSSNPEVQSFFYLFYLIVHYDAGNRDILVSSLQSFYRFLNKKKQVSRLEREIILFLKKQSKIDSKEKIRLEFIRFKKILETVEQSYLDKYILKYFDLAFWLESKINDRSFVDVVRGKFRLRAG